MTVIFTLSSSCFSFSFSPPLLMMMEEGSSVILMTLHGHVSRRGINHGLYDVNFPNHMHPNNLNEKGIFNLVNAIYFET